MIANRLVGAGAWLLLASGGLVLAAGRATAPERAAAARTVARPVDHGRALVNPGMGFVLHHYDNSLVNYGSKLAASDALQDFPGLSTVYLRLAWSYLEPEEGRFRWEIVDSPAQRWIARGKKIAFRFTASEGEAGVGTPEWVRAAGAKGYCFEGGTGVVPDKPGCAWEPDFDDPVFLEKLDRFLSAAAARYDGDPNVAWVDVGSFGIWGEGHTFWSTKRPYSAATTQRHIELTRRHFRNTLVAANDDFSDHGRGDGWIARALELGLTLRDDSVMVEPPPLAFKSAAMAQPFWPRTPVILESEHYGGASERGTWGDGHAYLDAVEAYHASYASIHWWPREFLAANRALVDRMNRRLGYRLQLVEASWPEAVPAGEPLAFAARWRNAGVAPCLPGGHPALTLEDARGAIAAVLVDPAFDVRNLPVGAPGESPVVAREASLHVPDFVAPGEYEVRISIGSAAGTPVLALPHDGDDGQRRYRLGRVRVSLASTAAAPPAADGRTARAAAKPAAPAPFALRRRDRVVFYGDSITQAGGYGLLVEAYVVTRFPEWEVRFENAGVGGDTVRGGWAGPIDVRLQRDVIARRPSVVTVMLGMNDGGYKPFEPATLAAFRDGYASILKTLKQALPRVRLTVIRSSPFDDVSRQPQFAPGYDDALRRLGCLVEALGRREKATVVDFRTPVNDGIAAVLRDDPELARMLLPDRVHPGTAGHLLMGATLLRAWNAPPLVARVEIDAAAGRVASAENTTVTELTATADGLAWTQLDRALPLPVAFEDADVQLAEKAGADLDSLDSEPLVVRGLASGRYELRIDGQSVGTFSAADLVSGVNLALYNTPQRWQAFTARWSIEDSLALQLLRRRLRAGGADDARAKATVAFLDAKDDAARRDRREACRPKPRRYQLAAVAAAAGSRHN